jgi:hypothetical protein
MGLRIESHLSFIVSRNLRDVVLLGNITQRASMAACKHGLWVNLVLVQNWGKGGGNTRFCACECVHKLPSNVSCLRRLKPTWPKISLEPCAKIHAVLSRCHELASISAHFALISWFLSLAASRFSLVRSSRCARKHLLTSVFAPLHMPIAFHMNPRAWHSSRRVMTSSQAVAG